MKAALLVNGLPASGKTSVARAVTTRTGWPLLTLDSIKEPFFDQLGIGDRDFNRALGRGAYHAIWSIIADGPDCLHVVIDAWFWLEPLEVLRRSLALAGVTHVAEAWCEAPPEVLAERYVGRAGQRHAGHPGVEYATELMTKALTAHPLGIFPLIRVDSTRPLDVDALMRFVATHLGAPPTAAL
ncbi:MAG: AAA family ATPase [Ancalomicrobiaceae bacterium]|nr:AAA family ATPase [Ancalomicrobiaceae bacterium]